MSFLKAEWRKLVLVNYVVEPALVDQYVPAGTELDLWQGKCFVSLVGFMFINTRLLGFKIPFHTDFEEVNLRFYVKRNEHNNWKRGVVFIKEIVPKPALTWVANTVYQENYETCPMKHQWNTKDGFQSIQYSWKSRKKWHSMTVEASLEKHAIQPNSEAEFIAEHYWGYAKVNPHRTNEYEVTHPKWELYDVEKYELDVDFEAVYGKVFSKLNALSPKSVMLAEGSEITVEKKRHIINQGE